jgi:hypothetical protein
MQLALADHSANLPEGEERDQCDSEDNPHKNTPVGLPPPMLGMLASIVFPLDIPTRTSSTTSKTKSKAENATALHKIG